MTPQLQQAIKLLQMNHVELQEFVEQELERNPLLERAETSSAPTESDNPVNADPISLDQTFSSGRSDVESPSPTEDSFDQNTRLNPSSTPGLQDSGWSNLRSSGQVSFDGEGEDAISMVTRQETLSEALTRQLNLHIKNQTDRAIGSYLIGMVNEAGYLTGDLATIAESLGLSIDSLETVLCELRSFEPTGVFARDLGECLRLQLQERNHLDPAMEILLQNLNLVAKRDFQQLKSVCKVDLEDIQDMIAELRLLNPKPGLAFGSEPIAPVVPDVFVKPAPDGNWIVELNSETLPRLLINSQYVAKVIRGSTSAGDKTFLSEAQNQATWLVKSLDQRAKTILKVSKEIVRQQDAFMVHGIQHLRPITLKTVADLVEMHESTISRVTSNKYISTPRGVFELKFFFTNAIQSSAADREAHSSESVRHRIRELIARETPENILSDDDLVRKLDISGIDIARRTVAKYRESLNILSSVQRRREARLKC